MCTVLHSPPSSLSTLSCIHILLLLTSSVHSITRSSTVKVCDFVDFSSMLLLWFLSHPTQQFSMTTQLVHCHMEQHFLVCLSPDELCCCLCFICALFNTQVTQFHTSALNRSETTAWGGVLVWPSMCNFSAFTGLRAFSICLRVMLYMPNPQVDFRAHTLWWALSVSSLLVQQRHH